MRKRIGIIAFSPVAQDARVLRQVEYLAPDFDLLVIGQGERHADWPEQIEWVSVTARTSFASKAISVLLLILGRIVPALYNAWFWRKAHYAQARGAALSQRCDAYHANDWTALPVAAEAARRHGARLVFDAHEYAPLEVENRRYWRLLFAPMIVYMLRKYAPQVDASMTVSGPIARRYRDEFGLDMGLLLNTPKAVPLPRREIDPENIQLVHHGSAIRDRRLETMIESLALAERRYTLHFILVETHPGYVAELRALAERLAPGRVFFHEPVPPSKIVERIHEYDIGLVLIEPSNYNYRMCMPNKMFDCVVAGLAVCTGPSPAMVEMVQQYGFGFVTDSFRAGDVAAALKRLSAGDIRRMRQKATEAAQTLNADAEMGKLVALYRRLLAPELAAEPA